MQSKLKTASFLGLTAAAIFLTVSAKPAAAQFSITANITGNAPSATANADVQNALDFLSSEFVPNGTSSFHMTADISWADLGFSATNGYTLGGSFGSSADYQTVSGASIGDAADPSVLVNNDLDRYLYGAASTVNTSGSYADFTIQLNNNAGVPWDYGMTNPINPNAVSLASVLYHEAIHSMGFSAFNNADGNYTFGNPTIWDTHLSDATTGQSFDADTVAQRQAVMVSGDANDVGSKLYFNGVHSGLVEMSAPSTFVDGSSDGSHIDPNQPDGGDTHSLLYPATPGGFYQTPSTLELSMLSDIGWKLNSSSDPVPEVSTTVSFGLLLALGMGGIVFAAKKKKAANQAA